MQKRSWFFVKCPVLHGRSVANISHLDISRLPVPRGLGGPDGQEVRREVLHQDGLGECDGAVGSIDGVCWCIRGAHQEILNLDLMGEGPR